MFGVGVGEGVVKWSLPDAHTDFIIAVAAEEYGLILVAVIIALYAIIALRSFFRLIRERENLGAVNLRAEAEAAELDEQIVGMQSERSDLIAAISDRSTTSGSTASALSSGPGGSSTSTTSPAWTVAALRLCPSARSR